MNITHELMIKASAATIFQAVSTENGISGWWAKKCLVGEAEGQKSLLKFNKEGMIVDMVFVTETLMPNEKVVWECTGMMNPAWLGTKIVTEISAADDGCKVRFSHNGFDEKWAGHEAFEMTKGTWNHFVSSLTGYCEGGAGQPW